MIIIKIETLNSAFEEFKHEEVARILRELADHAEEHDLNTPAFDINGNIVGGMEEVENG